MDKVKIFYLALLMIFLYLGVVMILERRKEINSILHIGITQHMTGMKIWYTNHLANDRKEVFVSSLEAFYGRSGNGLLTQVENSDILAWGEKSGFQILKIEQAGRITYVAPFPFR